MTDHPSPPRPGSTAPPPPQPRPARLTDPATGVVHQWDGYQWVPQGAAPAPSWTRHGTPPAKAGSANTRQPRHRRGGGLKLLVALAAIAFAATGLAAGLLNGQDVSGVNPATGEVSFYPGGGNEAQASETDIAAIESNQGEIEDRLDTLEQNARNEGGQAPAPDVLNIGGVWSGSNGFTYVISQFGELAVLEEQGFYGTTAYGEGQVFATGASFTYGAYDGSFGRAELFVVNGNRIDAQFYNDFYQTTAVVTLTR